MDDELLFEYKHDPVEQRTGKHFIRDKSFSFVVAVFAVAAVGMFNGLMSSLALKLSVHIIKQPGPIKRWLTQLRIMKDLLGYILFVFGFFHSCLLSLWEFLAGRERTEHDFATEMVELPDLVDQIETPPSPSRTQVKRMLPVPPAFVNEKDYPVDWLVYSKHLGVVTKTQADRLLNEPSQRILHHLEEKKEDMMDSIFIAPTSLLISRSAPSSPHQQLIPLTKHRSQSDDNFDEAERHITNNQFSPFMQSIVAT